jgi:hypothetical protein
MRMTTRLSGRTSAVNLEGVKVQVLLGHDDYLPSYALITEAQAERCPLIAQPLEFNSGSIVAMDRGHNEYAQFGKWTDRGVFFVTRLKDNAAYEVVEGPLSRIPLEPTLSILTPLSP